LRCTYAAIAMHVRSNCNAHTHQLLWDDKQGVFGAQKRRNGFASAVLCPCCFGAQILININMKDAACVFSVKLY
jgi:hypothetical protein